MSELQDVFVQSGEAYRTQHNLPPYILKCMRAIENCRTAKLGSHLDECDNCGHIQVSYNSCRNRHCPKCQTLNKERWIEARTDDLLNVGYFHVVFTLPDTLNSIIYQNQEVTYNILFKAVAETLTALAADKKHLGAAIGMTEILHTWGQNLQFHPHIHVVIPGGGLNANGRWVNSRKKFFLPVRALSELFKKKFLFYLKQAKLSFYGSISRFQDESQLQAFLSTLYHKKWVVYCKPPFKSAAHVVEYLGRYTHRVAISNNRIIKIEDGRVTFKWRDYKDHNKQKVMELSADEFIRRFLTHILPPGFTKIRHYGFLSPRVKGTKLKLCKQLTKTLLSDTPRIKLSPIELLKKLTGKDISLCPCCGVGHFNRASPPS
jgi:hypothetical protein